MHAGHPIACDPKYGDADFDAAMRQKGLNRLFLHARSISLLHPATEERVTFTAPLDDTLSNTLKALEVMHSKKQAVETQPFISLDKTLPKYKLVIFDWDGTLMDLSLIHI